MEMKQLESFVNRLRTRKHFTSCGLHVYHAAKRQQNHPYIGA